MPKASWTCAGWRNSMSSILLSRLTYSTLFTFSGSDKLHNANILLCTHRKGVSSLYLINKIRVRNCQMMKNHREALAWRNSIHRGYIYIVIFLSYLHTCWANFLSCDFLSARVKNIDCDFLSYSNSCVVRKKNSEPFLNITENSKQILNIFFLLKSIYFTSFSLDFN